MITPSPRMSPKLFRIYVPTLPYPGLELTVGFFFLCCLLLKHPVQLILPSFLPPAQLASPFLSLTETYAKSYQQYSCSKSQKTHLQSEAVSHDLR